MSHLLNNDRMLAVQIGGGMMILAGILCYFIVKENKNDQDVTVIPDTSLA